MMKIDKFRFTDEKLRATPGFSIDIEKEAILRH